MKKESITSWQYRIIREMKGKWLTDMRPYFPALPDEFTFYIRHTSEELTALLSIWSLFAKMRNTVPFSKLEYETFLILFSQYNQTLEKICKERGVIRKDIDEPDVLEGDHFPFSPEDDPFSSFKP